jgi:hypothetical protein
VGKEKKKRVRKNVRMKKDAEGKKVADHQGDQKSR